jgi:hypothetical protein
MNRIINIRSAGACASLALGLALSTNSSHAQAPALMSYQGRVTNVAGIAIGTGTPVNRKIIFRIFDAASGGARLYSETQTVTIANGEFSVLLGQGGITTYSNVTEGPSPSPSYDLRVIFSANGSSRYLELVVDDGNGTLGTEDQPISPRQRLTSTAYSFRSSFADLASNATTAANATLATRATTADGVTANSDLKLLSTPDHGLGWYGAGKTFNGAALNGPVLYGAEGGALGTTNGGQKIALRWDSNGRIVAPLRVDNSNVAAPANGVDGGNGMRLILWPGTATTTPFGLGIDNATLYQVVPSTAGFKWYTGTTERLRLASGGGLFLPGGSGANSTEGGSSGNFISFGNAGTSEDFLGYANNTFHLKDSPGGGDSSQPDLDVGGNIKSVGKPVPVAEESLRFVRGNVSSNATIQAGVGFTVSKSGIGQYIVTYSTVFSGAASVSVSLFNSFGDFDHIGVNSFGSNSFTVTCRTSTGGLVDRGFSFIAAGPR